MDRDHNAAVCLEQLLSTVSSTGIDACGQDGSRGNAKNIPTTSLEEAGTKPCIDLYRF